MGKVVVRHKGDLLCEARVGNHTLLVDVPEFAGGKDRGPTGTELFAASLASCMTAMVVFYGTRAGVDTADLLVEIDYDLVKNPVRLANVKVTIHLPNETDPERRQAVCNAAHHCPVHETIVSMNDVDIEVVD